MALMPTERMGPPPGASPPMRMTASWSGSARTYRIQVRGVKMRRNGELPSDHTQIGNVRRPSSAGKAPLAVHPPSACSGVKALRNTSAATAASRQAMLAFRSMRQMAPDLLLYPIFDVGEALARVPHREVVAPPP